MYDVFKDLLDMFVSERQTSFSANQAHETIKLLLNIDEKLDMLLARKETEDVRSE